MKSYRDARGVFYRTQAEAKASGFPFTMVDIPTDHAGLIAFVNQLSVPVPPPEPGFHPATEDEAQRGLNDVWPGDPYPDRPYQNGHPTTPFMGSRDPRAVFTCVNCGKDNSNGRS